MNFTLIGELAGHIVKSVPLVIIPTDVGGVLFWAVMLLVWSQYRRLATMERRIHGFVTNDQWTNTATSLFLGLAAGILGSLLMVSIGVALSYEDIMYLWPVALILLFVSPRYLCFSYAGGLVSMAHLITGWPGGINPVAIMGLVAILHFMEGLLVAVSGHRVATAVYLHRKGFGTVGAYLVQRFWPIPVMIVFLLQVSPEAIASGFNMPDWWPLIDTARSSGGEWAYVMTPVVAALGYSDVAITEMPVTRARRSALLLSVFSFILLGLCLIATRDPVWVWPAVLFGPLGHELMIKVGSDRERSESPRFVSAGTGVLILDLVPGGPAERMGLGRGDRILSVNDRAVASRAELEEVVRRAGWYLEVEVVDIEGRARTLEANRHPPGRPLGVITAPEAGDRPQVNLGGDGILMRYLKRIVSALRWSRGP
ncbi:MAG: PDZ domain-containing protein [Clostridia bacterium]